LKLKPGTVISIGTGTARRHGEVLGVMNDGSLHVRWEDGYETRIDPNSADGFRIRRHFLPPRPGRHDCRNFLLRDLPRGSVGAEVGVWKGDFSEQMIRLVKPRQLFLVDPWQFMPDNEHAHTRYGGGVAKSQEDMDTVYAQVQRRFSRHISENTVCLHRGTTETLSKSSGGDEPFLDWIYLDGDHNYNSVRSDLQHAAKYVRPGGFIMGDDYTYDGWWHDSVIRAVHELAASGDAKIKLVYRMQYVLVRK
jgi:hypothetical protein